MSHFYGDSIICIIHTIIKLYCYILSVYNMYIYTPIYLFIIVLGSNQSVFL